MEAISITTAGNLAHLLRMDLVHHEALTKAKLGRIYQIEPKKKPKSAVLRCSLPNAIPRTSAPHCRTNEMLRVTDLRCL